MKWSLVLVLAVGCVQHTRVDAGEKRVEMNKVEAGAWTHLSPEGGSELAWSGSLLAVAGPAHLVVWDGGTRVMSVDAPVAAPGRPRFAGNSVHWGPLTIDLTSKALSTRHAAVPPRDPRGEGERATEYAWTPDGQRLLAAFGGDSPRVELFDANGARLPLWREGPARALWAGRSALVVAAQDLVVFEPGGALRGRLAVGPNPVVLAATTDETRLLVVDLNQALVLVRLADLSVVARWPGRFTHGSIDPEGRLVAGLEPGGVVRLARIGPSGLTELLTLDGGRGATAVALSSSQLAVSGGGELRIAPLTLEH